MNWTPEKLAELTRVELQQLRDNAIRLNDDRVAALCTEELSRRGTTSRPVSSRKSGQRSHGDVVSEYHFVCERGLGVTDAGDGCFWSGSWVVSESNVTESIKYGAQLALHESKAEPSYLQGEIIDFRRASRDMIAKTNSGIEFLVRATDRPLDWIGGGSGEKGYRWVPSVRRGSAEAGDGGANP